MSNKLPWLFPATIDGTPRRAFFERVPEAKETLRCERHPDRGYWVCADYFDNRLTESVVADLCRAAVDRWARSSPDVIFNSGDFAGQHLNDHVTIEPNDEDACEAAHRLADMLGIEP